MRPPATSAPFRPATWGPERRSNEDCCSDRANPARDHLPRVRAEWLPSVPSAARDATSGRRFLRRPGGERLLAPDALRHAAGRRSAAAARHGAARGRHPRACDRPYRRVPRLPGAGGFAPCRSRRDARNVPCLDPSSGVPPLVRSVTGPERIDGYPGTICTSTPSRVEYAMLIACLNRPSLREHANLELGSRATASRGRPSGRKVGNVGLRALYPPG